MNVPYPEALKHFDDLWLNYSATGEHKGFSTWKPFCMASNADRELIVTALKEGSCIIPGAQPVGRDAGTGART
ncbi:hypothetical protein [Paenarthrobacter sp. NCHU4564]|uniref:hypothetical protein n=1 Tax=Paenarthrobacter sp. NCHU4564 TaxID=3451353 RepID=UPI003F95DE5C